MTFQFSFPTLKNLSMIRIGQAVLQKETRRILNCLRHIFDDDDDDENYEDYEEEEEEEEDIHYGEIHIEDLVSPLVQIREISDDLTTVIDGMLQQIRKLLSVMQYATNAEDVALIFDVHGRIDTAAVWRCYFEDQLNKVETVPSAMDLLGKAFREQIWCEIGAIIAKIMSLVGLDSSLLPKPQLVRNDDGEYVLAYCMGNLPHEPSCASVVSRLRNILWFIGDPINGDCLHIPASRLCEKFVFLREFFIAMDKSDKESFIEQVIPCLRHNIDPAEFAVEIITYLDDVMLSHLMVKISENLDSDMNGASWILYKMLHWPLVQFFMPLLELLTPFLNTDGYAALFIGIADLVPDQCGFGNLYSNLLLKFCQAIPLDVKLEHLEGSEEGRLFTDRLESLRHGNSKLHERVVKILSPQMD